MPEKWKQPPKPKPSAQRYVVQEAAFKYIDTLPIKQSIKDDLQMKLSQIIAKVHDDAMAGKIPPGSVSKSDNTIPLLIAAYLVFG